MNEPTDDAREKLELLIRDQVSRLGEFFDNVQIFANNAEQGGESTSSFTWGSGNWHARLNQARDWVTYHDEKLKATARRDFKEDNGSDP